MMEKAPDTMGTGRGVNAAARTEQNEFEYIANQQDEIELDLKDNLFDNTEDNAFQKYEEQNKRQAKRRKQRAE